MTYFLNHCTNNSVNSSQCLSYNNFHVLMFGLSIFYLVFLYNSLGYPKQLHTHAQTHTHTHTHVYGASLVAGIGYPLQYSWTFLVPQMIDSKESACNAGDLGSIPGSGRSPGGGHGNPLQHSCWKIPWQRSLAVYRFHGVTKSWTQLSD